ncbi:hypothetical protein ES332_A09G216800v1 [Gossypium tomentosum]|uniref:NAC domain-containing protein n=1 Tax=Gossypium tomentosum TaxID=34277 RepID=A0A5D2P6Q1_GOSTO|nr:hypothetical protein ES332_A09G216800v1 [Gossypium tomentosum]
MSSADMNLSINGQSQVPPGFRFHPTEEELLHYYLRKKVASQKIDLNVIPEVDLNKLQPWGIQEKCKVGSSSTPQNGWYFFSHKDKKYPTETRTNRATAAGFWKATGRDKIIYCELRRIGLRKTLVFYKGRAPHGKKSDWILHEYRLDDDSNVQSSKTIGDSMAEDGWVVCRVFRKKNYQKTLEDPKSSSSYTSPGPKAPMVFSGNEEVLDQVLQYMGKTCKMENDLFTSTNNPRSFEENKHEMFMHMPRLESPTLPPFPIHSPLLDQETSFKPCYQSIDDTLITVTQPSSINQGDSGAYDHHQTDSVIDDNNESKNLWVNDWVTLDRFVASQLNGQVETSKQQSYLSDPSVVFSLCHHDDIQLSNIRLERSNQNSQVYSDEIDLWSWTKSSSPSSSLDPFNHCRYN